MTTNKRPPKARYLTEQDILSAITAKQQHIVFLRKKAEHLQTQARKINQRIANWEEDSKRERYRLKAEHISGRADKYFRRADNLENRYLTILKHKLAAFRTGLLPGMPNPEDQSIPKV